MFHKFQIRYGQGAAKRGWVHEVFPRNVEPLARSIAVCHVPASAPRREARTQVIALLGTLG